MSNNTSLYGSNGNVLPAGDNVIITGTLTVNGCSILTDCSAFNLFPQNANTLNIGLESTTLALGATSGVTTVRNQLATANYDFPVADGTANQILKTDGAGNLSFANISTLGVSSITGTANQVIASSSTGAVTLSTPQDIATTSSVNFGSLTTSGDIAVNGGNITTTATNATLFNTNATNINLCRMTGSAFSTNNLIFIGTNGITYETTVGGLFNQNGYTTQAASRFLNRTTTSPILIMSTTRTSMKGFITITDDITGATHSVEFLTNRKGLSGVVSITIYAEVYSDSPLATFTVVNNGSSGLELYATLASTNSTDIYIMRHSLGAVI